jgi:anti-anti-sigma factor
MSDPGFVVDVQEGDPRILRVSGDIDILTSPALREAVEAAGREGTDQLRLDLGAVAFMDSSGLAVLVQAENRGVHVRVARASSSVRIAIEAAGLGHLLLPDA